MEDFDIHPSFFNVTSQRFANAARQNIDNVTSEKSFSLDLILGELKRIYDLRDIRLYEENQGVLKARYILSKMKESGQNQIILSPELEMVHQILVMADDKRDAFSKDLFIDGIVRLPGHP